MTTRRRMQSALGKSIMRATRTSLSWLAALAFAPALILLQSVAANAGPCLATSQPLLKIPEITSDKGVLTGTILLTDEERRLIFRSPGSKPGTPGSTVDCQPQHVRAFIGLEAQPKIEPSADGFIDPYPGPTLRARLGDVVKLTFVNQIDANRFPYSIDQGEKRFLSNFIPSAGCDVSSPGNPAAGYPLLGGDAFPDCFHGSSTGNIHFHGTHTNPNGTGDNVLLEVRPWPRDQATRALLMPPQIPDPAPKADFTKFFDACEAQLRGNVSSAYPQTWNDAPLGPYTTSGTWTNGQQQLLQAYDAQYKQGLWPSNKNAIDSNVWPQYYIGAYPYCFVIPEYKDTTWPPPGSKSPIMGQSPGTHWYHAHKHGSTAINVANGMTGVFIIEGDYDDKLKLFYGADFKQHVMVINQLGVSPNLYRLPATAAQGGGAGPGSQDKGPNFSVNGRSQPIVDMAPGEVQMWRIANTSGRSGAYFGGIAPALQWKQLAQDGVQFAFDNYDRSINKPFMMASGNRVDLLMKAPPTPGIYPVLVQHAVDPTDLPSALPVVLLQVRVSGTPAQGNMATFIDKGSFPQQPPFLTNIANQEVTGSVVNGQTVGTIANPRVITFASTPPNFPNAPGASGNNPQSYAMHTINGLKFEEGNPADIFSVTQGAVEEWMVVNATYGPLISHPFHIHINPFQIVEVFNPNATVRDPVNGTVPKYVFTTSPSAQPPNPALQCNVNVNDQSTWVDCHNDTSDAPRIWWDVFPIPSGAQPTVNGTQYSIPGHFRMRTRFVDYSGEYVLHCHILAHEDRGMMAIVQVAAPDKKVDPTIFKHH
jgi:FtsP/CotA-like multicopper oxidase with cupredoxin domain